VGRLHSPARDGHGQPEDHHQQQGQGNTDDKREWANQEWLHVLLVVHDDWLPVIWR